MAGNRSDERLRKQRSVAREYRKRGYQMVEQPRWDSLPSFLRGFSPDLIATKDDDCAVVEIKTARVCLARTRSRGLRRRLSSMRVGASS